MSATIIAHTWCPDWKHCDARLTVALTAIVSYEGWGGTDFWTESVVADDCERHRSNTPCVLVAWPHAEEDASCTAQENLGLENDDE